MGKEFAYCLYSLFDIFFVKETVVEGGGYRVVIAFQR